MSETLSEISLIAWVKSNPKESAENMQDMASKIKEQSLEIASLNARNAMLSLDLLELAETLRESAREHDRCGNVQLAMKHKETVKRVMG